MARSFTSTNRVSASSITPYEKFSCTAWVRSPNTSSFPRIFEIGGNDLSFNFRATGGPTDINLRLERDFSTSDGIWHINDPGDDWEQWTHVAVTYDGASASNDPLFYVNGTQYTHDAQDRTPAGTVVTTAGTLYIGNRTSDAARPLEGDAAWIGYHNVILTTDEIVDAQWRGWTPRGLQLLVPLWGNGSSEVEMSGNAVSLTVTGATGIADMPPVVPRTFWQNPYTTPIVAAAGGDPEGPLVGGKLTQGILTHGRLVG